jgi:hypothetical protein
MSLLALIQLITTLAGAAKDIQDIVDGLESKGHPSDAEIPAESLKALHAALKSVPTLVDTDWDINHENNGG